MVWPCCTLFRSPYASSWRWASSPTRRPGWGICHPVSPGFWFSSQTAVGADCGGGGGSGEGVVGGGVGGVGVVDGVDRGGEGEDGEEGGDGPVGGNGRGTARWGRGRVIPP